MRARAVCSVAGCPLSAVAGGRCPRHAKPRARDERDSAAQRGYGYRWREIRAAHLAAYPWCSALGCTAVATDVDHVVPRAAGGTDQPDNLESLCHKHHSRKTRMQNG